MAYVVAELDGICLGPDYASGRVVAMDTENYVQPRHAAGFTRRSDGRAYVKVYLGICADERVAGRMGMKPEHLPLVIFWMGEPERVIAIPASDIRWVAPVIGTADGGSWTRTAAYPFSAHQREFIEEVEPHVARVALKSGGTFDGEYFHA